LILFLSAKSVVDSLLCTAMVQLLPDNVAAHMAASLVSGVGLVIAMNPFDVVATRLYNQKVESGKGALYSGT